MEKSEQPEPDLLEKYQKQIAEFLSIDELNMKDKQMMLPGERHYWVGRLMFHKQEILKLQRVKSQAIVKLREKLESSSPVVLNKQTINHSVQNHEIIQKIDYEIQKNELCVDFLSRVEANLRDAQYGLNNLTKIITLETT